MSATQQADTYKVLRMKHQALLFPFTHVLWYTMSIEQIRDIPNVQVLPPLRQCASTTCVKSIHFQSPDA